MSDHGLRTYIQVFPNTILQHGRSFVEFLWWQNSESCKPRHLENTVVGTLRVLRHAEESHLEASGCSESILAFGLVQNRVLLG